MTYRPFRCVTIPSCSMGAMWPSFTIRSSLLNNFSWAALTSRRIPASFSEAWSITSPRSEMHREMASTSPNPGDSGSAMADNRGKSLPAWSNTRYSSRAETRVPLIFSSSEGVNTPPLPASETNVRMSTAPPILTVSLILKRRAASDVTACRRRASSRLRVGFNAPANSCDALKEA